jgi:hypothetical protein
MENHQIGLCSINVRFVTNGDDYYTIGWWGGEYLDSAQFTYEWHGSGSGSGDDEKDCVAGVYAVATTKAREPQNRSVWTINGFTA